MGIENREITRLAGHDCWNKKPDYKGGGQGPSTIEVFANYGIYCNKADSDRLAKVKQFRERLRIPDDGTMPQLMVYQNCEQFLRTVPLLQADPTNIEDIDTTMEDHIYDDACHICMARPLGPSIKTPRETATDKRLSDLEKGVCSTSEDEFAREHEQTLAVVSHYVDEEVFGNDMSWENDEYDDGLLIATEF